MTTEKHVKAILDRTFWILQSVYESQTETDTDFNPSRMSRIIFPKYKGEKGRRICEQELRFVFVEQLNEEIKQGWDVFYSVETPTDNAYSFSNGEPKCTEDGRSGATDLVIHDNTSKRIVLLEFKAKTKECEKDLYKLANEEIDHKYFVNMLENVDQDTFNSLHEKIEKHLSHDIKFAFWSLGEKRDVTKEVIEYKT